MLVLERSVDGILCLGDNIQIQVVAIRGDKVRLGVTAPKNIPVHRKEIYDLIKRKEAEGK